jgi:hypothetical protein
VALVKKIISDDAFMTWAESLKSCRYCGGKFVGPVCTCELPLSSYARNQKKGTK